MNTAATAGSIKLLAGEWLALWPRALASWSRFTRLSPPRLCLTGKQARDEGLTGSFAMIRLVDHSVVISLPEIVERGLESFGTEIMAHEIGHHVLAPADLTDNARLMGRIRSGLPTQEAHAPMVSNLYTDLLINDRLQRRAGLDMASIYISMCRGMDPRQDPGLVWLLYMRIYEILWSLPSGTLASFRKTRQHQRLSGDAGLGARLVRVYAKDWLRGAGGFAALVLPWLLEDIKNGKGPATNAFGGWMDATQAGKGGGIPDGLAEMDGDESGAPLHPAEDGNLVDDGGFGEDDGDQNGQPDDGGSGRETVGGRKNTYRSPEDYLKVMRSVGVEVDENAMVRAYYRELAIPHLIPFPSRIVSHASDPLPEGLDSWEPGDDLSGLDWMESMLRSPHIIPGATTVKRSFGVSEGEDPERESPDLYLGIDCSGSMANPRYRLSYPVLAGAITCLSALRAGASVMTCLSGEPGEYSQTPGFVRSEKDVLDLLTGYHGTGYAFGAGRLDDTFIKSEPRDKDTHLLIITDADIFHMLDQYPDGWLVAEMALEVARGGGTMVLNLASTKYYEQPMGKLEAMGWRLHTVTSWEDLVTFARAFSRETYHDEQGGRP